MNAGLYIRVSTLNQIDRDSLSTQESRLRAYCEANNYSVFKVYKDAGVSAKDIKRPELEELMRNVREGRINIVLVTKLDRITRSLKDLLRLVDFFHEHNAQFVSITQNIDSSGPFGRFMRDLLGLIAQLEREVTAERVAEDMHHRASLGKWNGGVVPYGYTTHRRLYKELRATGKSADEALMEVSRIVPEPKKLCVDDKETQVVKYIFSLYLETRSLRKTTFQLNSLGYRTRNGGDWTTTSVQRILTNPTYLGKVWYGKRKTDMRSGKLCGVAREAWKIVDGQHEAIVTPKLFEEVQETLKLRTRKPTRAFRTYLLSGLLRCGNCESAMHGYTFSKKGTGKEYVYYKCHAHGSKGNSVCPGMTVPAKELDDFVVSTLTTLSKDRHFLNDKRKMLDSLRDECRSKGAGKDAEMSRLIDEEKNLRARLDTLLEKLEKRLIDDSDFSERYGALKKALAENMAMQAELARIPEHAEIAREALGASFEEIASFGKNWEFLDERARASKIQAIVKNISVSRDKIDIQVFLDFNEASRMHRDSWLLPA